MEKIQTECAVIGAGFAGCTAALELAEAGKKVGLFLKGKLIEDCTSNLTAGGLAAVAPFNKEDSFGKHIKDTLEAGKGLNDIKVVEFCIKHFYSDVIEWLVKKGVKFDKTDGKYDLHEEGGHSARRVFHVRDKTGIAIMKILGELIRKNPNITVYEYYMAIDLITKHKFFSKQGKDRCLGLYVYDLNDRKVKTVESNAVFISTGGLGKVFLYTSNPDISTGDGFAMCYRAGLKLANMEFIQFHPTVFYDEKANPSERRFLFTEALRGEGAILKLHKDSREDFVLNYHKLGSKATRDIVTRAEDIEMRKNGLKHVWLDCTGIDKEKLKTHFKNAYEFCLKKGIDLSKEPVPVVYAVHYSNGGVLVGKNGETELAGCYVLGETSYTGLHGATRLASNSAPECILFGKLAAKHFLSQKNEERLNVPLWNPGKVEDVKDQTTIEYYWETIRRTMTNLCGISRNKERLEAAKEVLSALNKDINAFYWNYVVTKDFLEVRNIADVAGIIVESALERKESRACHFREDFPEQEDKYLNLTIVRRKT